MKILIINSVCGNGSTGRIVSDIWSILKKQKHTVKIAYGVGEATNVDSKDTIRINNKFGYYTHNILAKLTDHTGLYSSFATRVFIAKVKEFAPDVIHLHNLHGYYINYEILFTFLAEYNKPVIWTLHDCWAFTGHCSYFNTIKCEQWKTHCSYCSGLHTYPLCYFNGDVSHNFDIKKKVFTSVKNMTLVTPSQWLADLAKESFLNIYPIVPIPNGIDLEVFKPTESDFKARNGIQDKIMVLSLANVWSQRKGYEDMIELAKCLDDKYKIVMVGLTQEQCSQVPKSIIPIQRTNNVKELAQIYTAADVFVNPSYEETMGLVTAEALACGTPAVVYDQTAVPEIVDAMSGIVVQAGNIEDLAKGISQVAALKKSDIRKRAQKYEKYGQYEKYIDLYVQNVFKRNVL